MERQEGRSEVPIPMKLDNYGIVKREGHQNSSSSVRLLRTTSGVARPEHGNR